MKTLVRSTLAVLALVAIGCGGSSGYSTSDIKAAAPTGTVNGQAWTMTKAVVTSDGTTLSVNLYADANVPDCGTQDSASTTPFVIFNVPAKTGTRPLQLSLSNFSDPNNQTVTIVTPPSSNNIAVDGIINVSDLTSTSATIGLLAKAGSDQVNGTFTTTLCQ